MAFGAGGAALARVGLAQQLAWSARYHVPDGNCARFLA